MTDEALRAVIESALRADSPEAVPQARDAVREVLDRLAAGTLRVAEPDGDGGWRVHAWIKEAILLHFRLTPSRTMEAGIFEYFDKVAVQGGWREGGPRVVPAAVVREGTHVAPGVVLMPCFVNIGAHIGPRTMIDTWATVGSCAQIGADCHISGGVGIGGVLEPVQATPVIVEDNVFIGARSEVAEGCIVREGAVLAMGCYLGRSTPIFDATAGERLPGGEIPARAVVVPGSLPSRDGSHHTYALIVKKTRDASTDARTALNEVLR